MAHKLFLVDGSGFIFRAYHALPPLTRPDGTPVGAVMGFCNMLAKLIGDHPDAHIAVIFDAARLTFRNDIYPEYKAHRPPAPEDLVPQFPLVREAAHAFGLPSIELPGYEADDVIATYARLGVTEGHSVTIVSSDKDLMQLVRDGVQLMDPMKRIMIGPAQVVEKFGVPPEKVVDVQSLAGDSSDNVPGVPGIGLKTAAELILEYGSLENLLDHASDIKQNKRRENLIASADLARISKKLVTLCDTAPVPIEVGDLKQDPHFKEALQVFLKAQGFNSLYSRYFGVGTAPESGAVCDQLPVAPVQDTAITTQYTLITSPKVLADWLKDAHETHLIAVDTETTGLTPAREKLVGISLATRAGRAAYIPVGHGSKPDLFGESKSSDIQQADMAVIAEILRPYFMDPAIIKVGHNFKFDQQMFMHYGLDFCAIDDTMLMSYVLDGSSHGHGLDELAELHCAHKMISYDEVTGTGRNRISFAEVDLQKACEYAAEDADFTLRLYHILKPRLAAEKMTTVYEDIERPLISVIARMEWDGVQVDRNVLRRLSQNFGEKISLLEAEIQKEAGHPFNVASPKQLGVVLFEEMGLQGGNKTKTGDWSTSADILENLAANGHAFVEKILDWRHLSKLRSTYTEALQEAINPATGRVHTSFAMALTNTGRLSSSDPNLQNIPIRTEEGRMIRTAFVAPEGSVLLSADYSQIELRLLAEMADLKSLQESFRNGEDIHMRTAMEVFGVPLADMTPEIRRQAKAINFGIVYGISGFGLAKQLGCSVGEASTYIKSYLAKFPELVDFMEETKAQARRDGYIKTLFGRKCVIAGIQDKNPARRNFAERQAINAPLQGTAADIVKMAMTKVSNIIIENKIPAKMLLQVHDELVFEIPETAVREVTPLLKTAMESVVRFNVPLLVETGQAKNWADAH